MWIRKHTNSRISTDKKKGSILTEASVSLPIFITAIIVLSSILLYYITIEDANFILASEMRRGAAEGVVLEHEASIPIAAGERIRRNHSSLRYYMVKDYGYRVARDGLDELICVKLRLHLATPNPFRLAAKARYDAGLMTRAYVGKIREAAPMSEDAFMSGAEAVYIFPKDGVRYHKKNCTFVRNGSMETTLSASVLRSYSACTVCGSGKAGFGARVYIYPAYGETYHLPGCGVLERNYVEVDKEIAIRRGYTPCSKCGG